MVSAGLRQQLHQTVRDLSVPQAVQVRSKCPGQQHEHTHVDCAEPHQNILTYVCPVKQEELEDEHKARGKVEKEQNPVSQQGDPGPGKAALPDALGPRHHVEANVAVKNEAGADERTHEEEDVDPHHVVELNKAQGDEDQTHGHGVMRLAPLCLHQDHKGERVHSCQNPHPHQYAVGPSRWEDVVVMQRPADCCVGVHHHEGDCEHGTAVGGDCESRDQLAQQPGDLNADGVADEQDQVEDEEEHVGSQGVGHQQVARLLTQRMALENAHEEEGVGHQRGHGDHCRRDEEIFQMPDVESLCPVPRQVSNHS